MIEPIKQVISNANHRFCVKYLHDNFKKEHKAFILKKKVWNIANAYVKSDYKATCKELVNSVQVDYYDRRMSLKKLELRAILKTLFYAICYITTYLRPLTISV